MSDLLQQGIAAARAGHRTEARTLLMRALEADERNEQAWLWLSGVVDDPNDMRTCLHNVLELNPNNTQARQGLAWVDTKYGPAPPVPEPKPEPPPPVATTPAPPAPTPSAVFDPLDTPAASYTGPTTRLMPEPPEAAPQPRPEPPPTRQPVPDPPPAPAAAPTTPPATALPPIAETSTTSPGANPCPYCGTPTVLTQKSCTQCRQSLMMPGEPAEKRSLPLTILGWLWILNGVLTILGGILGTLGALVVMQSAPSVTPGGAQVGSSFSPGLLLPIVIGILIGVVIVRIGRGLLRRQRWTYYVVIGLSVLGLIGALCNIAQIGALAAALSSGRVGLPPGAGGNAFVGIATAVIVVILGLQLIYLLLVALSYRDFFGQPVRFQPSVEPADDTTHYNNGIAYKNRGMWYMTVQEWFAASRKKPHDKMYLQALGLAYAQIKKVYPTSPTYLRDVEGYLTAKRADLYMLAPELEQIKLLG